MKKTLSVISIICIITGLSLAPSIAADDLTDHIYVYVDFYGPVADVDHDGYVNGVDVSAVVGSFLEEGTPGWTRADTDKSGKIDGIDVSEVVGHYLTKWIVDI